MANFRTKIFGSVMDKGTQQKLEARQHFASPNYSTIHDSRLSDETSLDTYQAFSPLNGELDLNSRTPFIRMWTAIQVYDPGLAEELNNRTQNTLPDREDQVLEGDTEDKSKNPFDDAGATKDKKKEQKVIKGVNVQPVIYEIGNHILNTLSVEAGQTIPESMLSAVDISDVAPGQFQTDNNKFMRPPTGITGLQSQNGDDWGATRKTTVNFKVNNFADFDRIYQRYFLKPGAQVFIDFGWSNVNLYNPLDLINSAGTEEVFLDDWLEGQQGEMETLVGNVVNYDAKFENNGTITCMVEIVSKNFALLGFSFKEEDTNIKSRIVAQMENELIQFAAQQFSDEVSEKIATANWQSSGGEQEDFETIANAWAQSFLSSENNIPAETAIRTGVHWHGEESRDRNLYICFGLFEDKILNTNFGFGRNYEDVRDGKSFNARFDSSTSYTWWDDSLYKRQSVSGLDSKLKFLYPLHWNDSSYNYQLGKMTPENLEIAKRLHKQQGGSRGRWDGGGRTRTGQDKDLYRVPVREIFISVEMIKQAFEQTNNVKELVRYVLDEMNKDSQGIFDLRMYNNGDDTKLSVVDQNRLDVENKQGTAEDLYQSMFLFKPHSPGSIVTSMDLGLTMPSDAVGNQVAISNASPTQLFVPKTGFMDRAVAMELIERHQAITGQGIAVKATRYVPDIGGYRAEKADGSDDSSKGVNTSFGSADSDKVFPKRTAPKGTTEDAKDFKKNLLANKKEQKKTEKKKKKEQKKKGKSKKVIDYSNDDASREADAGFKIASNFEEYYTLRAASTTMVDKVPTLLPIKASLSLYGTSGISPGDCVRIDYLPEKYSKLCFFQLVGVSHEVNASSWKTTIEGKMRISSVHKERAKPHHLLGATANIVFHKNIFDDGDTKLIYALHTAMPEDGKSVLKNVMSMVTLSTEENNYEHIKYIFKFYSNTDVEMNFPWDGFRYGFGANWVQDQHGFPNTSIKLKKGTQYKLIISEYDGYWAILARNESPKPYNVKPYYSVLGK